MSSRCCTTCSVPAAAKNTPTRTSSRAGGTPPSLEPPLRPDGKRDFATLTGLLKQPQAALGERGYPRPVWHCSMRAAPGDRMLSDDEWAAIAHEVMHRTGLSPYGQEDEAVRWVAVRHFPIK